MDLVIVPQIAVVAGGGLVGGLGLLVRGFRSYRTGLRIADTATSTITSLAVGEVRVSGIVEPAELTLVSPLQSVTCVYYRSSVRESAGDDGDGRVMLGEERSVGFRVRDAEGAVRVFPRDGRFDVPDVFAESTDASGDEPPGLQLRDGPAFAAMPGDHEAQVAALLTVRRPEADPFGPARHSFGAAGHTFAAAGGSRRRRYAEARIEPGQVVTVVGQAIPFSQLTDPDAADAGDRSIGVAGIDDPEVARNIAAARAAGTLLADPAAAWGNAAIPGFGIGQPVTAPALDPAARSLPLAAPDSAERTRRTFEIGPEELVIAAVADTPLLVALGPPSETAARHQRRFLVGLLGAVLAIGSGVALGVMLTGGFGT